MVQSSTAKIIKAIMSSAAEDELRALYINARKAAKEQMFLEEMGHPQPPTPMQTDNSTTEAIINSCVQPKCTKAMDMCFYWLCNWAVNKKQFFWHPGVLNFVEYWSKHHPVPHHNNMRPEFLTPFKTVLELHAQKAHSPQRCVKLSTTTYLSVTPEERVFRRLKFWNLKFSTSTKSSS